MKTLTKEVIVVPLEKISVEQNPSKTKDKNLKATISQKALLAAAIGAITIAGWLICKAVRYTK